jgi:hypothetical protein
MPSEAAEAGFYPLPHLGRSAVPSHQLLTVAELLECARIRIAVIPAARRDLQEGAEGEGGAGFASAALSSRSRFERPWRSNTPSSTYR